MVRLLPVNPGNSDLAEETPMKTPSWIALVSIIAMAISSTFAMQKPGPDQQIASMGWLAGSWEGPILKVLSPRASHQRCTAEFCVFRDEFCARLLPSHKDDLSN